MTPEETAEIIHQRQVACDYHKRTPATDKDPQPTWVGTSPTVCAFCGIKKTDFESAAWSAMAILHAGSRP